MSNTENGENVSEQMLLDMSNQLKLKFDENEKEMECIKREKFMNDCEMMSWFGLIEALDTLIGDSGCPPEIQTISEVLTSKAERWVRRRLTSTESEPVYFRQGGRLNIEIIDVQDNNNNN